MAGLGFKDFQVGEVLTSSDVDGYLMQQTVMRFADSGARGSALGTAPGTAVALAEGMVTYLQDTDVVELYDGSAWTAMRGLVAVKHALFTGTQTNSTASGANFAVTDLSITHAMSDASHKLIISAYLGAAAESSRQRGAVGVAVADGGTLVGIGDAASSRTRVGAGGPSYASSAGDVTMPSVTFVYEPGDVASHTYTVRAINVSTLTGTVYINRNKADSNNASQPRAASGFVIQEVSV